jgi:hypothetical protein
MEACTVEVGLLRKHACGQSSVAHCANCEQALCSKHAIAQLSPSGARTGKFLCEPCNAAAKAYAKAEAAAALAGGRKPAPRPAPEAHKPAPAAQKKPDPAPENSGALEFTPEPKKPTDKK